MKDTKTRILDAAEELFSEQGIGATSLRSITARAEVNLASIHYHFGSRHNLILRVYERRLAPINSERLHLLDQYETEAQGQPVALEHILKAFLKPPLYCGHGPGEDSTRFIRLLGRLHTETQEIQRLLLSLFDEVAHRFISALKKTLPEFDESDLFWNLKFTIGAMGMVLVGEAPFRDVLKTEPVHDPEVTLEKMITFLAAGFRASRRAATGE